MKNINVCFYCKLNDLNCVYHFAFFWYYLLLFFQPLVLFDKSGKCTESLEGKKKSQLSSRAFSILVKNRLLGVFFLSFLFLKGIRKRLKKPLLRRKEV